MLCFLISSTAYCEWKDLKKELKTVLRKANSLEIQSKLEECESYDQLDTAEFLISLIDSSRTPLLTKVTACRVLSKFKNDEARKEIAKETKSSKGDLYLLKVLTFQKDEHCRTYCEAAIMRSSNTKELTVVIRALGHFKECKKEVMDKLFLKLGERNGSTAVKRAIIEALGGINTTKSAPILINLFKDKNLGSLAIDSMQRLTGQSFGNDPSAWRKWLGANKDFQPVNIGIDEYWDTKRKLQAENKAKNEDNDSAEFYGVKIKGKNILFVLDKSGSMSAQSEYGNRLDHLKKEFFEMLDTIGYDVKLGVLWFAGNDTYPSAGIEKVTESFKGRLKKHMKRVGPSGGTPIGEAMEYAFKKIIEKREIDTIYLLSDGQPNGSPEAIQFQIKVLNSSHFIKIHTISIGEESEFLKNVATDNYGSYTEIK